MSPAHTLPYEVLHGEFENWPHWRQAEWYARNLVHVLDNMASKGERDDQRELEDEERWGWSVKR